MGDNNLLSKYHMMTARAKDLQSELDTKSRQWKERENMFKITDKLARELCESILGNKPGEMVLGKEKSWDDEKTDELIRRSKDAYIAHFNKKQKALEALVRRYEARGNELEAARLKINQLENSIANGTYTEDMLNEIAKRNQPETDKKTEAVKKKDEDRTGKDSSAPAKKPETKTGKIPKKANIQVITEDMSDDGPFDDMEDAVPVVKYFNNEYSHHPNRNAPVAKEDSKKAEERKEKANRKEFVKNNITDQQIENISSTLSDTEWQIVEYVGETGEARAAEIYAGLRDKHQTSTDNRYRTSSVTLVSSGVLRRDSINGNYFILRLTVTGKAVYIHKFNRQPKESEATILEREHNNLEHGYGIRDTANKIRETGKYPVVDDETRTTRVYNIGGGGNQKYIPDIYIEDENKKKIFIEYETGKSSNADLNTKLSKMINITDIINIIVPKREEERKYIEYIKDWMRPQIGILESSNIKIRLATKETLGYEKLAKDEGWDYIWLPSLNGTEPYNPSKTEE